MAIWCGVKGRVIAVINATRRFFSKQTLINVISLIVLDETWLNRTSDKCSFSPTVRARFETNVFVTRTLRTRTSRHVTFLSDLRPASLWRHNALGRPDDLSDETCQDSCLTSKAARHQAAIERTNLHAALTVSLQRWTKLDATHRLNGQFEI